MGSEPARRGHGRGPKHWLPLLDSRPWLIGALCWGPLRSWGLFFLRYLCLCWRGTAWLPCTGQKVRVSIILGHRASNTGDKLVNNMPASPLPNVVSACLPHFRYAEGELSEAQVSEPLFLQKHVKI